MLLANEVSFCTFEVAELLWLVEVKLSKNPFPESFHTTTHKGLKHQCHGAGFLLCTLIRTGPWK